MRPIFGIERELCKDIFYKECENDSGDFHFHSHIEICMVDAGQTRVIIGSREKVLKAGDISIALSYDAHLYRPIEYAKTSVLIIPSHLCTEFTNFMENKKNIAPFISNPALSAELKLYFEKLKKGGHNEISARGYIYTILGLLVDTLKLVPADTAVAHSLTSGILEYIHKNFKSDISIKSIAHAFGYNQSYISRSFKAQFTIGLKKYVTLLRLKNAVSLMHQNKDISYCAFESGFTSLRTFYNVFEAEFGCTPKEYIKSIHGRRV